MTEWLSSPPKNKLTGKTPAITWNKTPEIGRFFYFWPMKKNLFKILAKINKAVLPSLAKQQVDMSKATKLQLALIGWRYYVTKNSLD